MIKYKLHNIMWFLCWLNERLSLSLSLDGFFYICILFLYKIIYNLLI